MKKWWMNVQLFGLFLRSKQLLALFCTTTIRCPKILSKHKCANINCAKHTIRDWRIVCVNYFLWCCLMKKPISFNDAHSSYQLRLTPFHWSLFKHRVKNSCSWVIALCPFVFVSSYFWIALFHGNHDHLTWRPMYPIIWNPKWIFIFPMGSVGMNYLKVISVDLTNKCVCFTNKIHGLMLQEGGTSALLEK